MPMMKRRRSLKLLFSLLIFWVALELALQGVHLAVSAFRPAPRLPHPGAPVVLCLGDSHTYGVKVPPPETYPAQLQARLDRQGLAANVVNLGLPGQNTSELRRSLPELLERYRPAAAVILSGANNDWNRHDVAWSDLTDGKLPPGLRSLFTRAWYSVIGSLRTVRLVTYVWNETGRRLHPLERVEDREGRVYFHDWRGKGVWETLPVKLERTRRDLFAVIDLVRDAGAEPLLLTYAGQPFAPMEIVNLILIEVAQARAAPLINNDAILKPLFIRPDGTMDPAAHDRLFLTDPGETHLAGPGYAIVAENVAAALVKTGRIKISPPSPASP